MRKPEFQSELVKQRTILKVDSFYRCKIVLVLAVIILFKHSPL